MLTDEQINYINSSLDSLDLQEIEKKYTKDVAEPLDYKKLLKMNVSESFILDFIEKYK